MDKLINFPTPRAFRNYPALLRELQMPPRADKQEKPLVLETLPEKQATLPSMIPFCAKWNCLCERSFIRLASHSRSSPTARRFWMPPTRVGGIRKQRDSGPALQLRIGVTARFSGSCPPAPVARGQQHLISMVADAHNQAVCDLKAGFAFAWLTEDARAAPELCTLPLY